MLILSFYLEQNECFVSLETDHGRVNHSLKIEAGQTQGMVLVPFIEKVWKEASAPPIAILMAPKGPGAFTNIRVTLATAQGLALAFPEAHIFSPTNFDVLAHAAQLQTKNPVIVLIDSKKGNFYGQVFVGSSKEQPQEYTFDQLRELLGAHPDMKVISDSPPPEEAFLADRWISHNENLAACQIGLYNTSILKETPECQTFEPYYLYLPNYVKSGKHQNTPNFS